MKIRKCFFLSVCLTASLIFSACGSKTYNTGRMPGASATGVEAVLSSGMAAAESSFGEEKGGAGEGTGASGNNAPDSTSGNGAQTSSDTRSGNGAQSPSDPTPGSGVEITDVDRSGEVLDLTAISSTLVYSEVYNMIYEPELYVGKTIIMEGSFAVSFDESTGNYYYGCIIQDATACCAQGMEFVPAGKLTYPDDFPELGTTIRITGVYGSYTEASGTYYAVMDATF